MSSTTAELRKQIKSRTVLEEYEDTYQTFLEDTFENSPNYELVTRNTGNTQYKIFLADYNTDKNLVGYKKFVQYPYSSQVFYIGDYIIVGSDSWLVFAIDNQFTYNIRGKIRKCNNILKWRDSNDNLLSYKCVVEDKINNSDLDQNRNIVIPEGGIVVYCQQNSDTSELAINKRFVLSRQSFKINSIINYSSSTFMTLIMQLDNIADDDDLDNGIADNSEYTYNLQILQSGFTQQVGYTTTLSCTVELNNEVVIRDLEWISSDETKAIIDDNGNLELLRSGNVTITCRMVDNIAITDSINVVINSVLPGTGETIISPDNYTILQGYNQTYTVYKYIDNDQQIDTFTITASGVPTTYYTLSTTNNSFTVTNIKAYTTNDLTVSCLNNITSEITTYDIKLKGFW